MSQKLISLTSIIAISALVIGVSAHADQGMKSTGVINVENTQNPAVYDVIFDVRDIAEMDKMITVGKTEISRVINEYSNQNVLQMDSFENFTESVSSLTELPDNTYYYDRVTAGKDCKRYIKQGGEYYECNANGIKTGTTPLSDTYATISIVAKDHATAPAAGEVQLVEYELATEPEMSAGYTGYADKKQIIGSGEDGQFAYNDAFQDGYNDAVNNTGETVYNKHVHTGSSTSGGGCYTVPVYHSHSGNSSSGGGCYGSRHTSTSESGRTNKHYHNNSFTGVADICWDCSWCGSCCTGDGHCRQSSTYYSINCGKSTSTVEKYNLGCGKNETTIDSATIIFD